MAVSQSQIKVARRCMKKHHYKYIQHLAKKVRAAALFRGTILHEMIEARLTKKNPHKVLDEYEKKYRQLFREEREEYGETFIEDIRRVFDGYERAYTSEPLKYLHIEKKGEVELPNGYTLKYIVDGIATDQNGRRWLVDRKSHKNIPEERDRFSDIQLVLYYWAWNIEHPKEKVDGVIWDYLRTKPPAIPEQLKKGELTQRANIDTDHYTYAMEIAKLQLDPRKYREILAKLKGRGSMDFFQRVSLPSPPGPLVKSVVADAADTAAYIEEYGDKIQTRNLTRDCSWCEFFDLCHAELRGLDASFIRKTKYEEKDPDERYKED